MKAIVVGGGLAGCAAAFRLRQAGWQVRLIERTDQLGGRANTVSKGGYLIDTGASAVASSYVAYMALARQAGLGSELTLARPYVGIIRDGKVVQLDTRRMGWSGARTSLLSLQAKLGFLKLMRDVHLAKSKGMLNYSDLGKAGPIDNESAQQYAVRELNQELGDYFCDPLVRVMTLANSDRISKVEFFSGIVNVLNGSICSMRGGQQRFANVLADNGQVEYGAEVTSIAEGAGQVTVSWENASGSRQEYADACVVACPLDAAWTICPQYRSLLGPLKARLRYTKVISVAIGASVSVSTDSFMVLVPNREQKSIATLFLEHNKSLDRAPQGHSLISAYYEVSASEARWHWEDRHIVAEVTDYLLQLFPELRGAIDMTHVKRWDPALPLMEIGGFGEIGRLNEQRDPGKRIQFAGDYLSGAGQNTAISFGVEAAANLVANLSGRATT